MLSQSCTWSQAFKGGTNLPMIHTCMDCWACNCWSVDSIPQRYLASPTKLPWLLRTRWWRWWILGSRTEVQARWTARREMFQQISSRVSTHRSWSRHGAGGLSRERELAWRERRDYLRSYRCLASQWALRNYACCILFFSSYPMVTQETWCCGARTASSLSSKMDEAVSHPRILL